MKTKNTLRSLTLAAAATLGFAAPVFGDTTLVGGSYDLASVDATWGTWVAGDTTAGGPVAGRVFVYTGDVVVEVNGDRAITKHFQIGETGNLTGSLTFDIASGKTLTVTGVVNTSTSDLAGTPTSAGPYFWAGGALNVSVDDGLCFTGGGNLVFSNNSAKRGGAMAVSYCATPTASVALDFSSLAGVQFVGNVAEKSGGGIDILNYAGVVDVTFGNNVLFRGNRAGTLQGGGIRVRMESQNEDGRVAMVFGDRIVFDGNTSGSDGGGVYSFAGFISSVGFGDDVLFQGNRAEGFGGAIFSAARNVTDAVSNVTLGASARFVANSARYDGGAIYSSSVQGSSVVEIGDNAVFLNNTGGQRGNAIFSRTYSSNGNASAKVIIGDNARFESNTPTPSTNYANSGGAIAAIATPLDDINNTDASAGVEVTIGAASTFKDNVTKRGGGAIHALASGQSVAVTVGANALFAGNDAGAGVGGAIWAQSNVASPVTVTIHGNSCFRGNKAVQGGAIYILGTDATLNLDADAGDIVFSGNAASGGYGHAIFGEGRSVINLSGANNLYFDNGDTVYTRSGSILNKTGAGFAQFVGKNSFDASVNVTEGTLRIVNAGVGQDFATGAGQFLVSGGTAALAGGGEIASTGAFVFENGATLSPDSQTFGTPVFDTLNGNRFGAAPLPSGSVIGTLTLDGDATFEEMTFAVDLNPATGLADKVVVTGVASFGSSLANTLDISNVDSAANTWGSGQYVILEGGSALTTGDLSQTTFKFKGVTVDVTHGRLQATLTASTSQLILETTASASIDLVWNAAVTTDPTASWDKGSQSSHNWRDATAGTQEHFQDGDRVRFVADPGVCGDVHVATGLVVGHMAVEGGNYTFAGGKIVGVSTSTTGTLTADGALEIALGASASFVNALDFNAIKVDGTAAFANVVDSAAALHVTSDGRVTLLDGGRLGNADALDVRNNGTLVFDRRASSCIYNGGISGGGAVIVRTGSGVVVTLGGDNSGAGAFLVQNGALSIASDANIGVGSHVLDGGVLQLTGASYAKSWAVESAGGVINNAGDVAFGGSLRGDGALAKTGGGALELTNSVPDAYEVEAFYNQSGQTRANRFTARGEIVNGAADGLSAALFSCEEILTDRLVNHAGSDMILKEVRAVTAGGQGGVVENHSGAKISLARGGAVFFGTFSNSGLVVFSGHGDVLRVSRLENLTAGGVGEYIVDVDFSSRANTGRIELAAGGVASGRHVFWVAGKLSPEAVRPGLAISLVSGENGGAVDLSGLEAVALDFATGRELELGIYRVGIAGSGNATLRVTGYNSAGQAMINTVGAMSTAWFGQLDNLASRQGELRLNGAVTGGASDLIPVTEDFWVRAYGQQINSRLGLDGVAGFREYQYGMDAGYDHEFVLANGDKLFAGAFLGAQAAERNFHDPLASKGHGESFSLGVYATWLNRDGWYADGVLKGQFFSNRYDAGGLRGDFDNQGAGFLLEIGRRVDLGGTWFLEPSAQMGYTHIFAEDFSVDTQGVHVGGSDIFRWAAGLSTGRVFDLGAGRGLLRPSARAGVEYQASSGGTIRTQGFDVFRPTTDGVRGVLGLGVAWQFSPAEQLHLEYEASFGEKYNKPWSVNAGYRIRF
ncbi:MAG: autotransporter outer membrane beta-barrel domain-containing protein [Puniceicoccales bacterium]|jgi:outer membrane autotransporter protein|nr:autotransporter outer membrane beta-barrel domain-containing protein [Puniceicoccales bacterium]